VPEPRGTRIRSARCSTFSRDSGASRSVAARWRRFGAGDTVVATPGTWHWHGAGPDTLMTHITVYEAEEANDARWGALVTDAEYSAGD
jgi:hypothetical protein